MSFYWWYLAAIVFFLLELPTRGFVLFWLGIAAVIVGIADLSGLNGLGWQVLIFVVAGAILTLSTRFISKNWLHKTPGAKTNMDALIDQVGVVTEAIDNMHSVGRMLVLGQDWMARSEHGHEISVGTKVRIVRSQGATLIVKSVSAE